jgi:hypothetical protein
VKLLLSAKTIYSCWIFAGVALFLFTTPVFAQQVIKGIVVDSATFSSLPNVSVQLKNTLRGTTTDLNGNFSIIATENDTLILSLVGYQRVALALFGYESSVIRMSEQSIILPPVDILSKKLYENPYDGMFDDQRAQLKKKIPFYYSKAKKDRIKAGRWREESVHVQTYVDVVINNPETKNGLIKKHQLSENEYYEILARFNEKHYQVMYFLTAGELTSLLNRFFESQAP